MGIVGKRGRISPIFSLHLKQNLPNFLRSRLRRSRTSLFSSASGGRAQKSHIRERVLLARFQKNCLFRALQVEFPQFFVKGEAEYPKFSPLAPSALANISYLFCVGRRAQKSHIRERVLLARFQKTACFVHYR